MFSRWLTFWDRISSSFWFVPVLMVLGAILLIGLTTWIDGNLDQPTLAGLQWIYGGDARGAQAVLSAIAGSMITVAALVFSIVIVVLALASNQFGPRILRTFMRDKINQLALGTFIATFLYSLLALRLLRFGDAAYVPHVTVTVAVALALASLLVLIYFIHHVARCIQAPHIVAAIGDDLGRAIDRLYPEPLADGEREERAAPESLAPATARVLAERSGYLPSIVVEDLLQAAHEHDLLIELCRRPGDFVLAGTPLASWQGELQDAGRNDAVLRRTLQGAFTLGNERTHTQDVRFPVEQLVEVALRALSPSVHDPFTALNCLEQLGVRLAQLAQRRMPPPCRYDAAGWARVLLEPATFAELVELSLRPIARQAPTHLDVLVRMLGLLRAIATLVRRRADRDALQRQTLFIGEVARERFVYAADRADLERELASTLAALQQSPRERCPTSPPAATPTRR